VRNRILHHRPLLWNRLIIGRAEVGASSHSINGHHCPRRSLGARPSPHSRGFSLVELIVVISVAVGLTALLMPAMAQLHENAHRVVCMSNESQMGQAFIMYGHDHNDNLPYSVILHKDNAPQELMAARRGAGAGTWDGIGVLFEQHYLCTPECFYCPSHHGEHPFERYADQWFQPIPGESIYTNYHYCGDIEWKASPARRSMLEGHALVLATDGLRTTNDFNHRDGYNVLRADGSVRWKNDTKDIFKALPESPSEVIESDYLNIWDVLEAMH
jgi:prepilin-type N-terminal cleavage/methylation domain-containing protein